LSKKGGDVGVAAADFSQYMFEKPFGYDTKVADETLTFCNLAYFFDMPQEENLVQAIKCSGGISNTVSCGYRYVNE
jgi:hypothetical protein